MMMAIMVMMMMMVFISNAKINSKMKMITHIYTRHKYFCPGNFEQLPARASYQIYRLLRFSDGRLKKLGLLHIGSLQCDVSSGPVGHQPRGKGSQAR